MIGVLLALAGYTIFVPPEPMSELPHRLILPFVLIASAFTILDNLRMRTHMAELIGAIKGAVAQGRAGRGGSAPTPEQKGEAIEILIHTLDARDEAARKTAFKQLAVLSGADFGEDAKAWRGWWNDNKSQFGK